MKLEKYSFGVGDRFGHQGKAQLEAMLEAKKKGIHIIPVWNKSNREHSIIGTVPADTRSEADAAVKAMKWQGPYHVDADHINLGNVEKFVNVSDFFTIDVADAIGKPCTTDSLEQFVRFCKKYAGKLSIEGIDRSFKVTDDTIRAIGTQYLHAVEEAAVIYRHLVDVKGKDAFITEVSMDETNSPQTPLEMFFILAAMAMKEISAQTIAPKFTGRFNKGVDYVGDVSKFEVEFNEDVAVIAFAVKEFGLPQNLKLSIHSGSDKFSIYKPINKALKRFGCGLHVKTAGTTWLEEVIGLASAGGEGLTIAKDVYAHAFEKRQALCEPYATVIDIDPAKLPALQVVNEWSADEFANALRHVPGHPAYNPSLRQLIHVGYKVAAQMGKRYTDALKTYEPTIAECVRENIFNRHILPIFA
ncbi:MAG: tagaturonate epimerase family protein [Planctomycetaceae bacterium]|nr:tagaturonate epimerase family protein [Planctomycetaceae bacterium]